MAYVALATLVLLLPLVAESVRFFTLGGDEQHRSKLWIQHCHANQVLCVVVVSLWCGFGEFLISKPIFVFWLVPSVIMAAARAIRLAISKNVLAARWTTTDCLRIVFWATISATAPLLMAASAIHDLLARNFWGMAPGGRNNSSHRHCAAPFRSRNEIASRKIRHSA